MANTQRVWKSVRYGVSKELDTAYWGFLKVETTLDIFQNIIFIPYLEYDVLSLSGYGILSFILCGLCNIPKSSKTEDSTLPNQDTDEVPSNESQRNTTNPLVVFSDSLATDYDSADEYSVCITINKPSSAPADGKSSLASKTYSAPAGKLKNVKMEDGPPLAIVPPNALQNKYKTQFKMNCELCGQYSHLSENCYEVLFCKKCKRTNHKTCDHSDFMSSLNANQHHNGQGESSSKSKIISLRRGINLRNPQHVTKNCETCGSNVHTTSDHNDIEWFRKRETLQAKTAESFKANRNESSASRSKTPTKRYQANLKESHLIAVKRIFRYQNGTLSLGL
ncbi:hypothetical protein Tco_0798121 [Tanacetum coccineum]